MTPIRNAGPQATKGETTRQALVDAAKRLLTDRAPSAITGRDLAAEAGVNYGLLHHYFGGKDAALTAGMAALRDDFLATHGDAATLPLLTGSEPYLRALVRAHIDDPHGIATDGEFPIGSALVEAVAAQLGEPADRATLIEARARAMAMVSIQLCVSVFGPALLDATGVRHRDRSLVEAALAEIYDAIALRGPHV